MGKQLGYPDKMTNRYWAKLGYPRAGLVFLSIVDYLLCPQQYNLQISWVPTCVISFFLANPWVVKDPKGFWLLVCQTL